MAKQLQRPKVVHKWDRSGQELTPEELDERRWAFAWATITTWAQANGLEVSFEPQEAAAGE